MMNGEIIKYLTIYLLTMVKFIAGPTIGPASGLSWVETVLITVAAMMTSVLIFTSSTFKENILTRFMKKKKLFTKRNRRFVTIWKRYGLFGVTFLTPIIFTPIGGSILVTYLGGKRKTILYYMLISATFWSIIFSTVFHFVVKSTNISI